jgi:hypothetical protein
MLKTAHRRDTAEPAARCPQLAHTPSLYLVGGVVSDVCDVGVAGVGVPPAGLPANHWPAQPSGSSDSTTRLLLEPPFAGDYDDQRDGTHDACHRCEQWKDHYRIGYEADRKSLLTNLGSAPDAPR